MWRVQNNLISISFFAPLPFVSWQRAAADGARNFVEKNVPTSKSFTTFPQLNERTWEFPSHDIAELKYLLSCLVFSRCVLLFRLFVRPGCSDCSDCCCAHLAKFEFIASLLNACDNSSSMPSLELQLKIARKLNIYPEKIKLLLQHRAVKSSNQLYDSAKNAPPTRPQ